MAEHRQLTGIGQLAQRALLKERLVPADGLEHLGGENEETSVDPVAVPGGLLEKCCDLVVLDLEGSEPSRWLDGRDRSQPALVPMEFDQGGDVHIGHPVSI